VTRYKLLDAALIILFLAIPSAIAGMFHDYGYPRVLSTREVLLTALEYLRLGAPIATAVAACIYLPLIYRELRNRPAPKQ